MSSDRTAKEIAAATGQRPVMVPAPYVRANGVDNTPETGVYQVYDLFLPNDGSGAHFPGSRSWAHVRMEKVVHPTMFFFHLLVMLTETTSEGSIRAMADRESQPEAYQRCVKLAAKASVGNATAQEHSALRKLTKCDHMVDFRFLHDVEQTKKKIVHDLKNKKKAKARGGGGGGAEPQNKRARTSASAAAAAAAATTPPNLDWLPLFALDATRQRPEQMRGLVQFYHTALHTAATSVTYNSTATNENVNQANGGGGGEGMALEAGVDDDDDGDNFQPEEYVRDGPDVAQKVIFTVTPVPREGGTVDNHQDVVGMYVRFLLNDTNINPGAFFGKVIANRDARQTRMAAPSGRSGSGGGPPEMFPNYGNMFYSNHPAGNSTTLQTYFQAAIKMCPDLLRDAVAQHGSNKGVKTKLFTNMNLSNAASPFHLSQILSTSRALAEMERVGAAAQFWSIDAEHRYWNPLTRVAGFPADDDHMRARTFKYMSQQVFWCHPTRVGLMEQYYPHIDMDSDFLSALIAGGSLENHISTRDPTEANMRDAEVVLKDTFRDLRLILDDHWIVLRQTLLDNNLLTYDTNNEFVHRAAEVARMNKKVLQYYPPHAKQTRREIQALIMHHGKTNWRRHVPADDDDDGDDDDEDEDGLGLEPMDLGGVGGTVYDETMSRSAASGDGLRPFRAARAKGLATRIRELETYNEIRNKQQEACLKIFCGLWQLEGDVDDLPIPASIRAMLRWYRDNERNKFPNLTREFAIWDPDLGLFGNSMLRQLAMYASVARILQPIICLLGEGLFSCYHWAIKELCFNLMAHGRFDVGKTYTAITTLLKYTTIPGTVEEYCMATGAADTTLKHSYDLIVASDEVPDWKVNKKEAAKFPERVNKEKVKMTSRQMGYKAFSFEKTATGESVRWAKTGTTDHYIALVEVTNAEVESKEALSSRYHRVTVPQPQVPSRELTGPMGAFVNETTVTYLNINQFLSACGYKAAMCGAMLPEPDMELFKDLSNRVLDFLVHKRAISRDTGERGLEIMKPYARQLVYHMAIHCAFDLPSSPNYMKKFETHMIRDLQPYLYCTTEIVWWCWTSMACAWIEENNSNVIRAALKVAGVNWDEDVSPYEHFALDVTGQRRIPFWEYDKDGETYINLHYVGIPGTWDQICRRISDNTCPKLSPSDVKGVLNGLADHQVRLPNNGYMSQPKKDFSHWHQYTRLPCDECPDGEKNTGYGMPQAYLFNNSDATQMRTESDVPNMGEDAALPAVDKRDVHRKNMLYIMPGICHLFQSRTIVDALVQASVCKSFRPGKMFLGLPEHYDARMMQVMPCPVEWIDETIQRLDEADGWKMDPRTQKLVWTGSQNIPEDARPVPRRQGIQFNRRGGISGVNTKFFTEVPTAPIKDGDTSWKTKCEADIALMQELREVSVDADYESAERQHLRCGQPVDAPVQSPAYVRRMAEEAWRRQGKPIHHDMDYPYDWEAELLQNTVMWDAGRVSTKAATETSRMVAASYEKYACPRKETTRAAIAASRKRQRPASSAAMAAIGGGDGGSRKHTRKRAAAAGDDL